MISRAVLAAIGLSIALLGACEDPAGEPDDGEDTAASTTPGEGTGEPEGDACSAEIVIGIFGSDACAGEPLMTITLPIDQPCVEWAHGDRKNSASRFQCYRDRLCYTQYVTSGTCDAPAATIVTDKETRTTCRKDETPKIYTKILGGTEGCPEAPEGFECPISGPGGGSPELAAACE